MELPLDFIENKIKFQNVASIQQLAEQVQDLDNILAISMSPLRDNDVKYLQGGLLQRMTLFIPYVADTKLLENLKLRLDSR